MMIDVAYVARLLAEPGAVDDPDYGWLCEEWSYAASFDDVLDPQQPTVVDLALEDADVDDVRVAA